MKFAYIFFNGKLLGNVEYFKNFFMQNKGDIFCADGGANLCYELNLIPNEIWGDLDSINKDILNFYEKKNVIIKKFPEDKNFTDSELILNAMGASTWALGSHNILYWSIWRRYSS